MNHLSSQAVASLFLAFLGLAVSCGPPAAAQTSGMPAAVECSLSWRKPDTVKLGDSPNDPKYQHQQQTIRVERKKEAAARLADIVLAVSFSVDEAEGSSVRVRAAFDDKPLITWLYQLPRTPPPRNQFVGGHGFTGLVYMTHPTKGGDYQFFCRFIGP